MGEKKREDSWNDEHDLLLAEVVLSHIRSGSTQLSAFEEAAAKINRTAAACGFRWNKDIRKKYENEIHSAKQNRLSSKQKPAQKETKQVVTISSVSLSTDIPVEQSISYNEALQKIIRIANDQMQKYDELLQENIRLREENNELILQKQQASPEVLAQEDLDAFLQIMKRAKSLTHV
ncbi:RsfA family transcriptional regulator [Paenibacillus sp. LMG 31460]|uniref:RsfA family transcriptional regulator n=1 Tax=Paenibacillus germinis TaxID=2654979 RepID=A0ABX1Z1G6_9BACL|nr:RsfA family transcriptional regulator [Paenibacillus germinis]NOU86244.1 RsfA family transcriptional regulator [Paenibacillus germinis]